MFSKSRLTLLVAALGFLAVGTGLFLSEPAQGQVAAGGRMKGGKGGGGFVAQPQPEPNPGGSGVAAQYSAIKLVENSDLRQYINVARDCIKDKAWNDACTAIQSILDKKEDFYVQVREKDPSGKETLRWTSVKFEANNLLGSMPEDGLDVYGMLRGQGGEQARRRQKNGDREMLAEVAQRYLHTKAGMEANDLLATSFLDRGQFFMAALRFEKLMAMNPDRVKLSELALFKAALSVSPRRRHQERRLTWKKL